MKKTTISVQDEDLTIFRILSAKTGIDLIDIMHMIAKELKSLMVDGIDNHAGRINFMVSTDLIKSQVIIRMSPLYFGTSSQLGLPIKEIEETFGYERDPKSGALIDTTEKKEVN